MQFSSIQSKFNLAIFFGLFFLSSCGDMNVLGQGMSAGAPAPYGVGSQGYKTNAPAQNFSSKMPQINTRGGTEIKVGSESGFLAGLSQQGREGRNADTLVEASRSTLKFMGIEKDYESKPYHYITTKWYTPSGTKGERMKVNSRIDTRDLNSSSLQLEVLKQVYSSGRWRNSTVSPSTVQALEDAIFRKTKLLNIQK